MAETQLAAQLVKAINKAHAALEKDCDHASGVAIERAAEIGNMLIAQKKDTVHGEWIPWVKKHLNFGIIQANNYMRVARNYNTGNILPTLKAMRIVGVSVYGEDAKEKPENRVKCGGGKATISLGSAIEWLGRQDDCDLLLTDPPYSTDVDDIEVFANEWLPIALAKVKPTGRAYVCVGAYPAELLAYLDTSTAGLSLEQVLVWTYRNTLGPSPKMNYKLNWQAILYYVGPDAPPLDCPQMTEQFSVQDINAPDGRLGDRVHAWQKPDELAERFVRHSTKPGDLVLDPFAGTGTFLIAAESFGCVARGCEKSGEMIEIATERGVSLA